MLGFSQGADIALAAALEAPKIGLAVLSVAVGDPAGVIGRKLTKLMADFASEGIFLQKDIRQSGITAAIELNDFDNSGLRKVVKQNVFLISYALAILRQRKVNTALAKMLCRPGFGERLADFAAQKSSTKIVVGAGGQSAVTPCKPFEKMVADTKRKYGAKSLTAILADEGHHTWGDNLALLATFYLISAEKFKNK